MVVGMLIGYREQGLHDRVIRYITKLIFAFYSLRAIVTKYIVTANTTMVQWAGVR